MGLAVEVVMAIYGNFCRVLTDDSGRQVLVRKATYEDAQDDERGYELVISVWVSDPDLPIEEVSMRVSGFTEKNCDDVLAAIDPLKEGAVAAALKQFDDFVARISGDDEEAA